MRGKREYSFLLSSPIRFSLIPFVVVEVVRSSNKGFVGENEYEFPITRSRWKREIWKIFEGTHEKNCQHFLFPVFSVHPPTIPGSGDRSEAIYPPGRNPFFFFSPPLLSSYPWVCCAKIVRPAAVFLRGISTGNVKLEDEENTRNEKKGHPPERERERDSRRPDVEPYDTRLWTRRKEVDYAPLCDSDI